MYLSTINDLLLRPRDKHSQNHTATLRCEKLSRIDPSQEGKKTPEETYKSAYSLSEKWSFWRKLFIFPLFFFFAGTVSAIYFNFSQPPRLRLRLDTWQIRESWSRSVLRVFQADLKGYYEINFRQSRTMTLCPSSFNFRNIMWIINR